MSDVITGIVPSVFRRIFGAGVLYGLGGLLIYIALVQPPQALHLLFLLLIFGAVSIYGGYRMWRITGRMIELTEEELRLSDGTLICLTEHIAKVDRSFFAFKPSNGFLITMSQSAPMAWAPGLWWRIGKRVGIGGLTSNSECKIMADTLQAMIAERDGLVEKFRERLK